MSRAHDDVTLRALAERFERSVREIEAELLGTVEGSETPADALRTLRRRTRDERRRRHRFYSGRKAKFHGIGARFVSTSGESVDLDWSLTNDGALVWDRWRLCWFARSVGIPISDSESEIVVEHLVFAGAKPASERDGFFRLG